MKKFLFLSLIFSAIISTTTYAQGGWWYAQLLAILQLYYSR
jgi:hypothetical protein